ncbi:forkhead box protein R1 [Apteryx rowi]|uniref:forkhead box protein R1 n=1 Tax=Apteryx rowi TaxID=308060 RepID=UPI000E1DCAA4|nr:forkhead box protein R1 [Apteryx rowi]
MYLSFQNKSFWENLHLKNGLEDWDMAEEFKLTTTTEWFLQGKALRRIHSTDENLSHHTLKWQAHHLAHRHPILGEPPEANGKPGIDSAGSDSPVPSSATAATEASSTNTSSDYSNLDCSEEDVLSSSSEAEKVQKGTAWEVLGFILLEDEDASCVDIPFPQKMLETPKLKAMPVLQEAKVSRPQTKKPKSTRQASNKITGGWPRPPLNYCILITLALGNSADGSLTVQQIYQFTRQHFPFFQTAPDSWKNTIRHNLCFSSSFEKTTRFVCGEGNRKLRLWKLTPEGRKKFHEEAQALPKEALNLVRQSMSEPGMFQKAGALL